MLAVQLLLFFLFLWTVVALFMYLRQEQFLFHPPTLRHGVEGADEIELYELQRPGVSTAVTLRGWLVNRSYKQRLLLYYGGNGEDVWHNIDDYEALRSASLFVQYRGYGSSDGRPGELELYSDALAVFDDITRRLEPDEVFVIGRSLGTAVAAHVAANRPVAGVILLTPFDSITAVAAARYPLLPVRLLLRHHFDTTAEAARITAPVLVIYGGRDTEVPAKHTRRLLAALPDETQTLFLAEADHGNITMHPPCWQAMVRFIYREPLSSTDPL